MNRSKFVGVVVHSLSMDEREPEDYILSKFSGEGNTSIVFGIAPRRAPQEQNWVLKFLKPDVRFELTVLHHSFEIAEELYPGHPLLMTPAERMRRLEDEMLGRIESAGVLFRIGAYRDLLMTTLELLAGEYSQSFKPDVSPRDLMRELGPLVPMIDDNLIQHIESNLDDDAFVDGLQPFFEQCLKSLQAMIMAARQDGVFRPFSQNALFKLLGLHLEDFINWEELLAISGSPQFQKLVSTHDLENFGFVVSALHFQASGRKRRMKRNGASDSTGSETGLSEFEGALSTAKAAARYLDWFVMGRPSQEHIQGMPGTGWPEGFFLRIRMPTPSRHSSKPWMFSRLRIHWLSGATHFLISRRYWRILNPNGPPHTPTRQWKFAAGSKKNDRGNGPRRARLSPARPSGHSQTHSAIPIGVAT